MNTLGDNLRRYRKSKGLTQEGLATLCNDLETPVCRSTIHNIESGVSMVRAVNIINTLCVALTISPNELMSVRGYNWTHDR